MSLRTVFLFLFLTLGIAACSTPDQDKASADPAATAPGATAQAPAETSDEPAAAPTEETGLEGVDETEGLAEDDTASGSDEITFDEPVAPVKAVAPAEWQYSEGPHFRRMTTSQGTSSPPDKIEVAEVFWYGCPHCYDFDPLLEDWKEKQPADVSFVRIPVIWNPTNQVHARAMFTAEALGIFDEAHKEIFRAIHQQGNSLSSQQGLATMFARLGIDNDTFNEAYNSFGVNSAVKRAENLTRRYGVRSVPVLIVNGKYATDGQEVQTFGDMLNLAEELVLRERVGE